MKAARPKVAVIDYGMCNLFSVQHACLHVGLEPMITSDREEIKRADSVVLPGVGAYGEAMSNLRRLDLISPLRDAILENKPVMAICLGMQILMSGSEEFGSHRGLDIIKGRVVRFSTGNGKRIKVPQIGWNHVFVPNGFKQFRQDSPLRNVRNGEYMYFVHSYYAIPDEDGAVLSKTIYEGIEYCSSLKRGNISAFQFHPEKSAHAGIAVYQAWAESIKSRIEE